VRAAQQPALTEGNRLATPGTLRALTRRSTIREDGVRTRRRENALFIHLKSGQVKSLTPNAVSIEFNPRTTPNKGARLQVIKPVEAYFAVG